MNDHQFTLLIQELQICKNEIIEKLEAIRCGIIDYENEVEKFNKNFREQKDAADCHHDIIVDGDKGASCIKCDEDFSA